ncbi:MAG TPA: carboxypeptidase regulatory-like domain-containing protein [Verrucomicrobiae bacterium]|nr:carboxypeptidase regulatory-like domain-containing protein [Verrucomicrobiae bacterium]
MPKPSFFMAVFILTAALFLSSSAALPANDVAGVALSGQVTSPKDGPMEGVVVGAKKEGSTITVNVTSDEKGRFSFPASKLEPGKYALKIRAAGYDLDGPKSVQVAGGKTATANVKIKPTKDLSAQLTDAEWLLSIPGTEGQKNFLLGCNGCHTVERIVKATHSSDEWVQVFRRMSLYAPGSQPVRPQMTVGAVQRDRTRGFDPKMIADWLASINVAYHSDKKFPLKTLPRPKGDATKAIVTEYDLPRPIAMPHDVVVDSTGMAWYSDFGDQFIGKLDPKTGKVTEFPIPVLKKGFPLGTLDLQFDKDENLWVALMYQGGIAKFDRKAEKFQVYEIPKEWQGDHTQQSMVSPTGSHVDGKVWTNNQDTHAIYRLDVGSGKFENLGEFQIPGEKRSINAYGIPADAQNNLYLLEFGANNIGRIDAKTKEFKVYSTVTAGSRPRRGRFDEQGRLWFAEYGANGVGMLDPKTEKIQEWKLATAWSAPYAVVPDKNGDVWSGSMWTDRVARLNPKTGQVTEYLLPRETNIRRVFVDNSTTPITFWVGSNHGASVLKLEPLERNRETASR